MFIDSSTAAAAVCWMLLLCFNQLIAYYSPGPRHGDLETLHQSALQQGTGRGWSQLNWWTWLLLILFSDYTCCRLQTTDVVTAFYTTEARTAAEWGSEISSQRVTTWHHRPNVMATQSPVKLGSRKLQSSVADSIEANTMKLFILMIFAHSCQKKLVP